MTTVADILKIKGAQVHSIAPDITVAEACHRMNEARIGALVVIDGEKGAVGIFTERDVLRRVVAKDLSATSVRVLEVMTSPITCCKPETTLAECQTVMTEKRLRHLPVVDHGELAGLISIGDILAQEMKVQQTTIEYLHEYLHGHR